MSVQLDDQAKDAAAFPDAPKARLSTRQKLALLRLLDTGPMRLRTVYGPVVTSSLGPCGRGPRLAVVTSPRGAQDVLGGTASGLDKGLPHLQFSLVTGPNVFTMRREQWQPRRRIMQPLFTKNSLVETRMMTLTGAGGSGKSCLAARAAAQMVNRFEHGAWWVELAPLTEPRMAQLALTQALGIRPGPSQSGLDAAADYLATRTALVVLDNCETSRRRVRPHR